MISEINNDGIVPEFLLAKINYSRPVRIGWTIDDPLVTECFGTNGFDCEFPGFEIEYCHTIIHGILKLDYELIGYDGYDALDEALTNKEVDIPGLSYFVDEDMASRFGWAPVYLWDGTALVAREFNKPTDDSMALLVAFNYDLWLAMVGATVVTMVIRWLSKKLYKERKKDNLPLSPFAYLVYVFRAKLFYVLWFLFLGILLDFYGNVFAVNILTQSQTKMVAFTDMMDLGRKLVSKECRLAMYDVNLDIPEFMETIIHPSRHNRSWAPLFNKAFEVNKPYYAPSREAMMDLVLNSSCVVGLDWWTMTSFFESHWCDVRVIMYPDERDTYFQYTYYVTRDDIRDAVYTVISHPSFQSFTDYLAKKYYKSNSPPPCGDQSNPVQPLTISKLQDGVYIWLIGLSFALIILIYQKVHARHLESFGTEKKMSINSVSDSSIIRRNRKTRSTKSDMTTEITPPVERRRSTIGY